MLLSLKTMAWAEEGRQRMVLMNFTAEANSYRDMVAAENFTAALQVHLLTADNGIDWVERTEIAKAEEELKLEKFGFTDNAGVIRGGQWMKADVSVVGRFSHNNTGRRTLFLEFLDLDRADVLLDETLVLNASTNGLLKNALGEVETVAAQLRSLLPKVVVELKRARQQKKVAVLFFSMQGTDADGLKQEFNEQLNAMTKTNPSLRLIRFPRPADAVNEANLAFSGMLDSRFTIENIADFFVWGRCKSTRTGTFDRTNKVFHHFTNYTFELNIADGKGEPLLLKKENEKARPDFVAALQEGVLQAAKSKATATNGFTAVQISKLLTQQAHDVNAVETACFLDPGNREAAEVRIQLRWGKSQRRSLKNGFRFLLERSEAWGDFVERFGLPPEPAPEVVSEYIDSILEPLAIFKASRYDLAKLGVPMDAGDKLLDEWRAPMAQEFVKRLAATITRSDLEPRLPHIFDVALNHPGAPTQPIQSHELRAKLIEIMAPGLKKILAKNGKIQITSDARAGTVATFNAIGRPDAGRRLLEELGQELPGPGSLVFSHSVGIKPAVGIDPETADTPEKQLQAGRLYERDENYQQAAEMYLKAAESGDANGKFALAQLYDFGKLGDDQVERVKAYSWYRQAAAQGHEEARAELAKRVKSGYGDALITVAEMFEAGEGVPRNVERAAELYYAGTISKINGSKRDGARILLSLLLRHGAEVEDAGVRANYFQNAVRLIEVSRSRNARNRQQPALPDPTDLGGWTRLFLRDADDDPNRQFQAGQLYEQGLTGQVDYLEAAKWYEKAARSGLVDAQVRLGVFYRDGKGVEKNASTAYKWFGAAASKGSAEAKTSKELLEKMTPPTEVESLRK